MSEPLRWEDSGGGIVVEASAYDAVVAECEALQRQVDEQAKALRERDELLYDCLPALSLHSRDFSQRALIRACELVGSDPEDWSEFPDVLARLRAALGRADA